MSESNFVLHHRSAVVYGTQTVFAIFDMEVLFTSASVPCTPANLQALQTYLSTAAGQASVHLAQYASSAAVRCLSEYCSANFRGLLHLCMDVPDCSKTLYRVCSFQYYIDHVDNMMSSPKNELLALLNLRPWGQVSAASAMKFEKNDRWSGFICLAQLEVRVIVNIHPFQSSAIFMLCVIFGNTGVWAAQPLDVWYEGC